MTKLKPLGKPMSPVNLMAKGFDTCYPTKEINDALEGFEMELMDETAENEHDDLNLHWVLEKATKWFGGGTR